MKTSIRRRILRYTLVAAISVVAAVSLGCVRISNGTWYFKSAATPEGWPELTPVGDVEVKQYPEYRAAVVTDSEIDGDGMSPMFMTLFRHIKANDIAMTAPVDMTYQREGDEPRMASMAFLYRSQDLGATGMDGAVKIEDLESRTYASVGVRGGYNARNYEKGLSILEQWLSETNDWRADGLPRYLGYNSPFVLVYWRYGEVQVPVVAIRATAANEFENSDIRDSP